jgi:hypothetical protein
MALWGREWETMTALFVSGLAIGKRELCVCPFFAVMVARVVLTRWFVVVSLFRWLGVCRFAFCVLLFFPFCLKFRLVSVAVICLIHFLLFFFGLLFIVVVHNKGLCSF